jgi:hypothetical protein
MSKEEDDRNLFCVLQTVRKMLTKRGYIVPPNEYPTYPKFRSLLDTGLSKSELSFLAEREHGEDKLYVFLSEDSK